jgi:hypothetical protein
MTGCGKSELLWAWFTQPHPRRISYDPVGDSLERNPRAIAVRSVAELRLHIARALAGKYDSWHFILCGKPDDAVDALDWLAPTSTMPGQRTLSRALGGVLFECGELDLIAPNQSTPLSIRAREHWQRGRHSLMSFAVATQAPALVSRIVSGNSHDIFAFGHSEATSLEYFRKSIGDNAADRIAQLEQFAFVHYHRGDQHCTEYVSERRRGRIERRAIARIALSTRRAGPMLANASIIDIEESA